MRNQRGLTSNIEHFWASVCVLYRHDFSFSLSLQKNDKCILYCNVIERTYRKKKNMPHASIDRYIGCGAGLCCSTACISPYPYTHVLHSFSAHAHGGRLLQVQRKKIARKGCVFGGGGEGETSALRHGSYQFWFFEKLSARRRRASCCAHMVSGAETERDRERERGYQGMKKIKKE
ncbi:hypothetical protein B0F90DRAFT_310113 [Multifurca ochricompacta]|uniref:Uncharacterized protein n=1 Tax=Multifurca ochricompacta TaxID=376703 RepID=A0AAD4QNQ8_9AGAM|nr:hypothetical protein B0F90DRAFT_310113 [Multifurca ochricompacta]